MKTPNYNACEKVIAIQLTLPALFLRHISLTKAIYFLLVPVYAK
jgi:hypothetical protein